MTAGGDANAADESDDLSAGGPVALRIARELAALCPLDDSCFKVAATGDSRGKGLFVGDEPIDAGTYLFDYRGKLLEQPEYDARYNSGAAVEIRADYAVCIERPDFSSVYLDGQDPLESNIARYMNHADVAPNCRVSTLYEPTARALMFASRDLEVGEEMCWDYGPNYWRDRDDKVAEARPWWKPAWAPWA